HTTPSRCMTSCSTTLFRSLKQMPAEVPGGPADKWLTIKKCPPLLDAMTGGYLIPLVADVWFSMKPDGVEFRSELNIIETHPQERSEEHTSELQSHLNLVWR